MTNLTKLLLTLLLAAALVGCGDPDPSDSPQPQSDAGEQNDASPGDAANHPDPDYDGPTYHGEIEPMMRQHCTDCHVPDDIAPFPLDSYEQVEQTSELSLTTMADGTMPPWPPDDDCGDFHNERHVGDDEIELFEEWIDAGHPEGDLDEAPDDEGQETDPADEFGEPDRTLDWGFDYQPQPPEGDIDDYRCFVMDPDIDGDRFINMVRTRPDNAEIVHHMIAFGVPEESSEQLEQLQAEDDRPGYECFGSPRVSDASWLTGWAPGQTPTPFHDGYGTRLAEDDKIVVQMHYNMLNDPEGVDRTEVDLFFVDEDEHPEPTELHLMPFPALDLHLDAGDPEATAHVEGPEVPAPITVHGIFPHMHLLGTEIEVVANTPDGQQCLVNVPNWDFDWQGFYLYEEPVELAAPSTLEMTCQYDNSADNQPDGRTPEDVEWGDGTYDEMCLSILVLEVPPQLEPHL